MAVLWTTFSVLAYLSARRGDLVTHRRWVIRSYAMTFAFVHVNFTYYALHIYDLLHGIWVTAFQCMVSWMINLVIAEIYIAATNYRGNFVPRARFIPNLRSVFR